MGNDNDNISTRLTYLLIGGGIGAVIALLFAPKSGQELRGDLADATRKGIDKSREAAQQIGERRRNITRRSRRATEGFAAQPGLRYISQPLARLAKWRRCTDLRSTNHPLRLRSMGKKEYQEETQTECPAG